MFFQQIIIPIRYFRQFKVLISKCVREYNTVRFARPGSRCAAINRYVSLYLGDWRRVRKHHSGALRSFIHHIQYEFDTVFFFVYALHCYFLQFKVLISKCVREYNTVRFARPGSRCAAINRYVSLYLGDWRQVCKHHSGALRSFIHHIQYEFDTVFFFVYALHCYFLQFKVLISKCVREYNTVWFARPGSRCAAINRYVSLYLGDWRQVCKHHSRALRSFIHHIQYEFDTVFFFCLCITFVLHLVSTIKFPLPKLNIFVCLNLTYLT